MSDTATSFVISDEIPLVPEQVQKLAPFFQRREQGTFMLISSIFPTGGTGSGWALRVSAVPAERREAIRKACTSSPKPPAKRKPGKTVLPFPPTPPAA